MIKIYKCDEMYLYEIIEDYKDAELQEEKDEIFNSFCSSIWSSSNKRRIYTKTISFNVRKDLLHTELGQVFNMWSDIEYKYYKSMTKDENWCSIIRQKINNIYTRYFDKEVILARKYMDLIKTPKRLYYNWISGIDMDANTVTDLIDSAIDESEKVKARLQMEKMNLSWNDYKKVIEGFLHKCFENSKPIGEYEDKTSVSSRLDFITEDNFYVGYICRTLEGYFRNYQKNYYSVRRGHSNKYKRCKSCGNIIENDSKNRQYCSSCKAKIQYYMPTNYKKIFCKNCDELVFISSKDNYTYLCDECRVKHNTNKRKKTYYKQKEKNGYIAFFEGMAYMFQNNSDNLINEDYYIESVIYPEIETRGGRYPYLICFTKNGHEIHLRNAMRIEYISCNGSN